MPNSQWTLLTRQCLALAQCDLIFSCAAALRPPVSSGDCPLNNGQFRPVSTHTHKLTFLRDPSVANVCEYTNIVEDIVTGPAVANDNGGVKGQPDTVHFVIKTLSEKIAGFL